MVYKLALFPLQSVVFPSENLPLHIYETKYMQLVEDCQFTGVTFGIPAYIDNHLEYGTEVQVDRVVKKYSSGAQDVICRGLRVFRIKEISRRNEDRIYTKGAVEFLENRDDSDAVQREQLTDLIFELYQHLEIPPPKIEPETITSYTLAHKIGLSLDQEYTLLRLVSEKERISFLINHLCITIPIVQEMNRTKFVIEMNGHFRDFNPLDFEDYKIQ